MENGILIEDITAQELLDELTANVIVEQREPGEITVEMFRKSLQAQGHNVCYKTAYDMIVKQVAAGVLLERVTPSRHKYYRRANG